MKPEQSLNKAVARGPASLDKNASEASEIIPSLLLIPILFTIEQRGTCKK
jgi:hypothetical protein